MNFTVEAISVVLAALPSGSNAAETPHMSDWTTITSVMGAVLTAMTAMIALFVQNRTALTASTEASFRSTLADLGSESNSTRTIAAASLVTFQSDPSRRYLAGESLCNSIRFERDIYVIDAEIAALAELSRRDSANTRRIITLIAELRRDLVRQIAQYAKGDPTKSDADIAATVRCVACEAPTVIDSVFTKHHAALETEMAAQRLLDPPDNDNARKWSIKITARSIDRLEQMLGG